MVGTARLQLHARHQRLARALGAVEARLGEAEATAAEAEEALAAAQQDALEVSQRLATLTGEGASFREDVGRLEQLVTSLDAEADVGQARAERA